MERWTLSQGSQATFQATIKDEFGSALAYSGTETLAAAVWAGKARSALTTLSPTWATPGLGTVNIPVPSAATLTLTPAIYRVRLTVTDAAGTHEAFEAELKVTWAPGSGTAGAAYCDIDDLRDVCPWIEDAQDTEQAEAGFARECAKAREWFDENCLRNYTGSFASPMGYHDLALASWFAGGSRRTTAKNLYLEGQLAADHLIRSPRVIEVNALYACSLVFQRNFTRNAEYLKYAAMFRHQAYTALVCTVAEIDVTGAGTTPHIAIPFSAANTMFA